MSRLAYISFNNLYTSEVGVRSLKLENLKRDIQRRGVDGIGLPEVRMLSDSNNIFTGNYYVADGITRIYHFFDQAIKNSNLDPENLGIYCEKKGKSHIPFEDLRKVIELPITGVPITLTERISNHFSILRTKVRIK